MPVLFKSGIDFRSFKSCHSFYTFTFIDRNSLISSQTTCYGPFTQWPNNVLDSQSCYLLVSIPLLRKCATFSLFGTLVFSSFICRLYLLIRLVSNPDSNYGVSDLLDCFLGDHDSSPPRYPLPYDITRFVLSKECTEIGLMYTCWRSSRSLPLSTTS